MSLRVVFVGTPEFAVPSLKAMASSSHSVVLVVTQPDRPSGRGQKIAEPAVKLAAQTLGLPVFQPESINAPESLQRLTSLQPDVIAVVAFGQKIGNPVLSAPRVGTFNLHASLLPKYRGAAPITYAIWKGETETGLTLFRIVEKMDAGGMAMQISTPIGPEETAGELHDRLSMLGAGLFVEFLDRLKREEITFTSQDPGQVSFAPSLKKEQGRIDWSQSAVEIARHVRAMTPWPGAYSFLQTVGGRCERMMFLKALASDRPATPSPGTVLEATEDAIIVATVTGCIRVERVQVSGKRAMPMAEYLRGHRVQPGDRFVDEG